MDLERLAGAVRVGHLGGADLKLPGLDGVDVHHRLATVTVQAGRQLHIGSSPAPVFSFQRGLAGGEHRRLARPSARRGAWAKAAGLRKGRGAGAEREGRFFMGPDCAA